jgi:hypothetical protein
MKTEAPRRVLRPRAITAALALIALAANHACGSADCADTESCGSFTPNAGCGWQLDDGSTVFSSDELTALGATWNESTGWTMPNGSHPDFTCGLPTTDAGMNGTSGTTGSQDSGNSGASNGGSGGNSGNSNGGNSGSGGNSGGNGGSGGVDTDGGSGSPCGDTLTTGCTPTSGIFVDASAPDGGDGSLAAPLNSIGDAFDAAALAGATDIYVCAGNYNESVTITDTEGGIDLHGGFNCNGFTYDGSVPVVSRSNGGYALYIDALQSPILIEDLAFTAVNASNPGESSIAAFISASTSVTFDRCQFTAGTGMDGDDGVTEDFIEGPTEGVNWPLADDLDGDTATNSSGGEPTAEFVCPGTAETTWGGGGGDTASGSRNGGEGGPESRAGAGGIPGTCDADSIGGAGTVGGVGADGNGASTAGTLDAAGFSPNDGGDGEVGEVGGGGGGGAGAFNGGGGGGGAGGCGGNFGPGGQGGGASIALLAYNSVVILNTSSLTSVGAGNGGAGDAGQAGQGGGSAGVQNPDGCQGGAGADGGNGGNGGGGAGGISVGLFWTGNTAPVLDQATTDAITFGTQGAAGTGAGVDNDGAAGFAEAIYEL